MTKATAISPLQIEWMAYAHTATRNQDEINHLEDEINRALISTSAEEQSIVRNEFRRIHRIADTKRVLYAARNTSARAQRRLDRLQNRVGCWDKKKCSPTTPMMEMQGRSAMDIFKEIEESLEDAMMDLQEVVSVNKS